MLTVQRESLKLKVVPEVQGSGAVSREAHYSGFSELPVQVPSEWLSLQGFIFSFISLSRAPALVGKGFIEYFCR